MGSFDNGDFQHLKLRYNFLQIIQRVGFEEFVVKVLLLENIQGLGKAGEVCEVKDGYGQNFLIAKGKAQLATNEVINRYKAKQKQDAENKARAITQQKQLAASLQEINLLLYKKVGVNNTLFGAVTKDEVAQALNEQLKVEIDKKCIVIKEAIKHIGKFQIEVKIGNGISAEVSLEVKGL